jgi:hypothetical protein
MPANQYTLPRTWNINTKKLAVSGNASIGSKDCSILVSKLTTFEKLALIVNHDGCLHKLQFVLPHS